MRHMHWFGPKASIISTTSLSKHAGLQSHISCPVLQVPFDLQVAHVDESAACSPSEEGLEKHEREIWESVQGFIDRKAFFHIPLEDVYLLNSSAPSDPKSRLDRRKQLHCLIQVRPYCRAAHYNFVQERKFMI